MTKFFVSENLDNLDSFSDIIKNGISYLFRDESEDSEAKSAVVENIKKNFIVSGAFDTMMPTMISDIELVIKEPNSRDYYYNQRPGDKSYAADGRLWYILAWARDNNISILNYSPKLREFASQRKGKIFDAISSVPYRLWYYHNRPGVMINWIDIELSIHTEECSLKQLLSRRYLSKTKIEDFSPFDVHCIEAIASRDPKLIQDLVEDTTFSKRFDSGARGQIYAALAKYDALSTKIARKIRSDSSEGASSAGIFAILANWQKITNPQNYISQCVDTNYPDIAFRLAREVPVQFVTFMAGSQHRNAREEAVRRMDQMKNGGEDV